MFSYAKQLRGILAPSVKIIKFVIMICKEPKGAEMSPKSPINDMFMEEARSPEMCKALCSGDSYVGSASGESKKGGFPGKECWSRGYDRPPKTESTPALLGD